MRSHEAYERVWRPLCAIYMRISAGEMADQRANLACRVNLGKQWQGSRDKPLFVMGHDEAEDLLSDHRREIAKLPRREEAHFHTFTNDNDGWAATTPTHWTREIDVRPSASPCSTLAYRCMVEVGRAEPTGGQMIERASRPYRNASRLPCTARPLYSVTSTFVSWMLRAGTLKRSRSRTIRSALLPVAIEPVSRSR